jgi:hypothetical protein
LNDIPPQGGTENSVEFEVWSLEKKQKNARLNVGRFL